MPPFDRSRPFRARRRLAALLAGAAVSTGALVALAVPATAAVPAGSAWAVSLGDSYISGEAGRWAGNSDDSSQTDALGPTAYYDAGTGELVLSEVAAAITPHLIAHDGPGGPAVS